MWIWILGLPVEPVEPFAPVEIGRMCDFIFAGKRVNGQRAQLRPCEHFEPGRNTAMMAPDYTWWHGFYELKKRFVYILSRANMKD